LSRNSNAPVVGWPPIRSFRKNIASSSISKSSIETQNASPLLGDKADVNKGLFVKINMDGIPIGRKINLKAYDGYNEISSAVDQLFRGLLAGINFYKTCTSNYFSWCILLPPSMDASGLGVDV
jgi:auxin-responsive protein IAA